MMLSSLESYPGFVAELEAASGVGTGFRRLGALHVALDRDEAEELQRRHALQRALGLEAEWLGARECRRVEPGLAPALAGGVHAPDEAAVDPVALAEALLEAARRAGAVVRAGAGACGAKIEAGRIRAVLTEDGATLAADQVVLAAGAWSGTLEWLPESARPPIRPVKGEILTLRGSEEPLCEGIVASERVYVVPRDDGRVVVGATVEERGFDTTVTAGGVHELLREAYRLLPDVAELELVSARAGLRPATPSNLPLIGPGELEGLVVAGGHFRNGVLLAPLTAELACEALAGTEVPA
jgi:glycine oxidase